ncbi:hypothetical protein ACQQ2Q_07150 [Agrobacterium sp. ES01]|uniref:hypothetical protein n=1 Tax=Agrobacterium sp. ES01 TaxID=3420714 RepID=UPI003D12085E
MTDASANSSEMSLALPRYSQSRTSDDVLESAKATYERMSARIDDSDIDDDEAEVSEKGYVPANWLDALPSDRHELPLPGHDKISAVNSDEAGLYRMFQNISP